MPPFHSEHWYRPCFNLNYQETLHCRFGGRRTLGDCLVNSSFLEIAICFAKIPTIDFRPYTTIPNSSRPYYCVSWGEGQRTHYASLTQKTKRDPYRSANCRSRLGANWYSSYSFCYLHSRFCDRCLASWICTSSYPIPTCSLSSTLSVRLSFAVFSWLAARASVLLGPLLFPFLFIVYWTSYSQDRFAFKNTTTTLWLPQLASAGSLFC